MRILALEHPGPRAGDPRPVDPALPRAEALRAWELYQAGIVRELYFRADRPDAVLVLECPDVAAAEAALATLPLVAAGRIAFELIPLIAYPGFGRLFGAAGPAGPGLAG